MWQEHDRFTWMYLIVLLMLSCVDCTGTQLFTWQCLAVVLIWSPFCWPMELMWVCVCEKARHIIHMGTVWFPGAVRHFSPRENNLSDPLTVSVVLAGVMGHDRHVYGFDCFWLQLYIYMCVCVCVCVCVCDMGHDRHMCGFNCLWLQLYIRQRPVSHTRYSSFLLLQVFKQTSRNAFSNN